MVIGGKHFEALLLDLCMYVCMYLSIHRRLLLENNYLFIELLIGGNHFKELLLENIPPAPKMKGEKEEQEAYACKIWDCLYESYGYQRYCSFNVIYWLSMI